MSADQLLQELLALPQVERERILCEVAASLPAEEVSGHHQVSDEEVARRVAEIDADPEGATVSHEEMVQFLETERRKRRKDS